MRSEAPPFWFQNPGVLAWALAPLGFVYGQVAGRRMAMNPSYVSTLPVLCVGNFITGGAGKTPTTLALAKVVKSMGLAAGFLSRGYGGSSTEALFVDSTRHDAGLVGDEPLLLAESGPTVVSADRPAGARLLETQKVDVIIMDDGFQNPSLHKDFSIAVVDAYRGMGNGFCIPAGPLRADLKSQITAASAILLVGKSDFPSPLVRHAARMARPVLQATVETKDRARWEGRKVLAFAGIADPYKFYRSLSEAGAEVVSEVNFHDHHPFTAEECQELLTRAKDEKLILATTSKDHARLRGMGQSQDELARQVDVLDVELEFENPNRVTLMLEQAFEEAKQFRRERSEATRS